MHALNVYSPLEDKMNAISHGIGCLLSIVATILLVIEASSRNSLAIMVSFTVFGVSLIALYTASTVYHSAKKPVIRKRLKIFDHAAIYILIAGTYTPFTLVTLHGRIGWILFTVTWSFACIGVYLKLFFAGQYKILSTALYVLMGWLIVFAYNPLAENLPAAGLHWLIAGGIIYTLGAVIYAVKFIKFNHAIFHTFVMIGSFCHFIAVYCYV